MKKLIEKVKDFFNKDKLPQKVSDHLEYTRDVHAFIKQSKDGKYYIPIHKEVYCQGEGIITEWNESIKKTINIHSYLSALELKERWELRGYNIRLDPKELEDKLIEGNDYILN